MRIVLVTETYLPQVNGVSRTLGQLVRVLGEAGDEVLLVHPRYREAHAHEPCVTVRSINPPFYPELYVPLPPFGAVHRQVEAFRPDLMHVATEATLGLSMLRYAQRRLMPVVSSFHTNFASYASHYRVPWVAGAAWRYLRWFHNSTRETYVPSNDTIVALQKKGFENLVRWPRGVNSELFRPDRPGRDRVRAAHGIGPDDIVIGHVSRLAAEKNVAYLAQGLADVLARRPATKVLIVGDGPARAEVEARLGGAAIFAGYRTGEDLADHYAAADVFAFASRTETFGNVLLEAMASGLPVVALREGGPAELVDDGRNGFLLDPETPPESFADRLLELVDNGGLRTDMGREARRFACSQSWDHIMLELRARYEAVVARAGAARVVERPPDAVAR